MPIIAGMTPVSVTDVKPFEMPIDEMSKGLLAVEKRADDVKNTILQGDAALTIETRPLEEDWNKQKEIRDEFQKGWQDLLNKYNGDYSKIDRSEIQGLAIEKANDPRTRQLTHAKFEYDAFNTMDKKIKEAHGTPIDLSRINPLTSSLYNAEGNAINMSDWNLAQHLDWQKAMEDMFRDTALGTTISNEIGFEVDPNHSDDMFKVWRDWEIKYEKNPDQLKAAYDQAVAYYKESSDAGTQHYEWLKKKYANEAKISGKELEDRVNEHLRLSFQDLMKKRIKDSKLTEQKYHIQPKRTYTDGGGSGGTGGGGSGNKTDEVVTPGTTSTENIGATGADISSVTAGEEAEKLLNGGLTFEPGVDVNDIARRVGSDYDPSSINVFDHLLNGVNVKQPNDDPERVAYDLQSGNLSNPFSSYGGKNNRSFTGTLQSLDELGTNFNSGASPYAGANNRSVFYIGGTMGGNKNNSLIDINDIDKIGELVYGKDEWNNRRLAMNKSGYESAFEITSYGDELQLQTNPLLAKAVEIYKNGYSVNGKQIIQARPDLVEKIEGKFKDLESFKSTHAPAILNIQEKYKKKQEIVKYLKGMDQLAQNEAGLAPGELDDAKGKNPKVFTPLNDAYVKSLTEAVALDWYLGYGYATSTTFNHNLLINSVDRNKLSSVERELYDETIKLMSDIAYNKLDPEIIKGDKNYFRNILKNKALEKGWTEKEWNSYSSFSKDKRKYNPIIQTAVELQDIYSKDMISDPDVNISQRFNDIFNKNLDKVTGVDQKIKKYYKINQEYKKDYTYSTLLYAYQKEFDTKDLGNLKQILKDKVGVVTSGRQMYNAVFNRQGNAPVLEELSEVQISDAINAELKAQKTSGTTTVMNINDYWWEAYKGIRFDKEAKGPNASGYVMQFELKFPTSGDKKFDGKIIEIPLTYTDFNQSELQKIGIDNTKDRYYKQIKESSAANGNYYFDLEAPGKNGKTTRFQTAFSDINTGSQTIKKGELYIVGEGDPMEVFDKSKIKRIGSYEEAMMHHTNRGYDPVTMQAKKNLIILRDKALELEGKKLTDQKKQQVLNNFAAQLGIPNPGTNWTVQKIDQVYSEIIGLPGGNGKFQETSYTTPDGNITVDTQAAKSGGKLTINEKQLFNNFQLTVDAVNHNEALVITSIFRPEIFTDKNGNPKNIYQTKTVYGTTETFVDDPTYGNTRDYNNTFQSDFKGFVKDPGADAKFVPSIANFLKDISLLSSKNNSNTKINDLQVLTTDLQTRFGVDLDKDIDLTQNVNYFKNDLYISSGRRSLESQLKIYGSNLRNLTHSDHLYGAGVDIPTNTQEGRNLLELLKKPEGQAMLAKNNLVAMHHTIDPTGKGGWHVHIEHAGSNDGLIPGSCVEQAPGNLSKIENDYTLNFIKKQKRK